MSKIETFYDRIEAAWCRLPVVRDNGRLQAAPFTAVLIVTFVALAHGMLWITETAAADWSQPHKTALWLLGVMIGGFFLLMTALVRAAKRQAECRT
ncbi:hypothetical protein OS189_03675 [Sulfitobacter sp. F26169L]|uniref:hypothetical protein n=1 Tax=Sulfitobacter sp. F26169L TaxID=2996015 RepID=UPI002260D128|nr:hypothetical protein [Sulfitobacter sp. F26169L]MCX7565444.1 hypothetical protein [Sulfitobacter sp. F26169L]